MSERVTAKPRAIKVTEPAEVARIVSQGKYREHLPHFQKDGEGLLVEVKPSESQCQSASEAK